MEKFNFDYVKQASDGYYELLPKYKKNKEQFYKNEYYQDSHSASYTQKYSKDELTWFENRCKEKEFVFSKLLKSKSKKKFLDLGCGEGYALKYFSDFGYDVTGIDFCEYAVKNHNLDIANKVIAGDIYDEMEKLSKRGIIFDIINADNVLDLSNDIKSFFTYLKKLSTKETLICIRVSNNFSILQKELLRKKQINRCFWVTEKTGDHTFYFNTESLKTLVKRMGGGNMICYNDFPIDLFLMNEDTNYIMKSGVGRNCYLAKIEFENMLYKQSIQKTFELHQAYAENGIGRDCSVVFRFENLN